MLNHSHPRIGVVIVSYQSEKTLQLTLNHLKQQSLPADRILVIDSASPHTVYLSELNLPPSTQVISLKENVGFSAANNMGFDTLKNSCDYILFLNPDAFLTPSFLSEAVQWMENPKQQQCAIMTGLLLGYNIEKNCPSGRFDSTGIFHKWYGNWYDRDQGEPTSKQTYTQPEEVPAICGALMFCRTEALVSLAERQGQLFDASFFMYKEDIDLSLRLRKEGWLLMLAPHLIAYHCRGWNPDRKKTPKRLRTYSAYNELKIHYRLKKPIPYFYSLLKLIYVSVLNK